MRLFVISLTNQLLTCVVHWVFYLPSGLCFVLALLTGSCPRLVDEVLSEHAIGEEGFSNTQLSSATYSMHLHPVFKVGKSFPNTPEGEIRVFQTPT